MKVKVNGIVIGEVMTNRSLTIDDAMEALGYDLDSQEDMKRGYDNHIEGFYYDDGFYIFDVENTEMVY